MRVSPVVRVGVAAGLTLGVLAVAGAAPSYAVDQDCANIPTEQQDVLTADRTGSPVQLMQVARAQQIAAESGRAPGEGVTVAVLDSGVADTGLIDVVRPGGPSSRRLVDYQGAAMAGLIGARGTAEQPIGIAPGATILDVRVYDRRDPDDSSGEVGPRADLLLDGLRHVAGLPEGDVGVLVVGLTFARTKELDTDLRDVLADLAAKDVLVVAASGDRPTEESDALYPELGYDGEGPPHGEDARPVSWPAGNPGVLAVNATGTVIVEDEAVQVVARLESTATGSLRAVTVLTGHGVVQPVEALTRPLRPSGEGEVGGTRVLDETDQRAEAPQPKADVLASTRRDAVWWGLLAGGALVIAVLLRPVLARWRG